MVDLSRLPGYFAAFSGDDLPLGGRQALLIALATLSAFAGAWIGGRHMTKATIGTVRLIVAGLMLLVGAALALGGTGWAFRSHPCGRIHLQPIQIGVPRPPPPRHHPPACAPPP